MARMLVVDDEESLRMVLNSLLKAQGHDVTTAASGPEAIESMDKEDFEVMISDIRMNPMDGMELLGITREKHPDIAVIMLTAYSSVATAIEALKLGAFDYLTKPFKVDELIGAVTRAIEYREGVKEQGEAAAEGAEDELIAESEAMKRVVERIGELGAADAPVLLCGETGVGKSAVARAIHAAGPRKDKRFLTVNCATLPEPVLQSELFGHVIGAFGGIRSNKRGLFEEVRGGTVFLDEIGWMPLGIQDELLRTVQAKEIQRAGSEKWVAVDALVVAAANTDLGEQAAAGSFLQELYDVFGAARIDIPPLRERKEDIVPLARQIVRRAMKGETAPEVDPEVVSILQSFDWPGNVEQLENVLSQTVPLVKDDRISRDMLPPRIEAAAEGKEEAPGVRLQSLKAQSLLAFLGKASEDQ